MPRQAEQILVVPEMPGSLLLPKRMTPATFDELLASSCPTCEADPNFRILWVYQTRLGITLRYKVEGQGMWVYLGTRTVQKGFGRFFGDRTRVHKKRQSETLHFRYRLPK
ncbi:hypothetical protein GWK47_023980 [Chionoecetes opilio]|uniref:Uncharacterized protein n=1 Tax=Chionoecetes opilio TaxID=41210 RepID=A0A8J4XLX0_CHIOP|nr:hypothetical protein GWK47_023980 [Chionoecetes opilio]